MTWYHKEKEFTEEDIGDYRGFIYLITEIETGKKYIGQKVFHNKVSKPPLKGKKNRRISKKMSDWQTYYGSNELLKLAVEANGEAAYNRQIIRLCTSKAELNYYETKAIFENDALLREDYYNNWVSARIQRNQLKSLIT